VGISRGAYLKTLPRIRTEIRLLPSDTRKDGWRRKNEPCQERLLIPSERGGVVENGNVLSGRVGR